MNPLAMSNSLPYENPVLVSKRCQICFEAEDLRVTSSDPGCKFLTCIRCKSSVHLRCYGEANFLDDIHTQFTCDRCKEPFISGQICNICMNSNGYLKFLDSGKWVHPICALCSEDSEIDDYGRMSYSIIGYGTSFPSYSTQQCVVCSSNRGRLIKCCHQHCNRAVHPHCAFHSKAKCINEDPKSGKGWQIDFEIIPPNISKCFPEIFKYLQGDSSDLEKLLAASNPEVPNKNPDVQNKYTNTHIQSLFEKYKYNRDPGKHGGNLKILCEEHKHMRLQCICQSKQTSSGSNVFLVGCAMCGKCLYYIMLDNWFHSGCIGISLEVSKLMRIYICNTCKNWQNLKRDYLLGVIEIAKIVGSIWKT